MTKPSDKQLIDAMNLVCSYCCDNLAYGWRVVIELERGDISCYLENPEGESEHCDTEYGVSSLRTMCNISNEGMP